MKTTIFNLFFIKNFFKSYLNNEIILVYKLVDSKSYQYDTKIGGNKLIYSIKEKIPITRRIFGIKIKYLKTINTKSIIFLQPLKIHWTKNEKEISYLIMGKRKNPLMDVWIQIKNNYSDIYLEQYNIVIDNIITKKENKELFYQLNQAKKKFIIIKSN